MTDNDERRWLKIGGICARSFPLNGAMPPVGNLLFKSKQEGSQVVTVVPPVWLLDYAGEDLLGIVVVIMQLS